MVEIGGFVGLAALVIGLFAWTRADQKRDVGRLEVGLSDLRTELKGDISELRTELKDDIAALRDGQTELREGQAELRERMAKLEGLLDGLREAVTWRSGPCDAA